jgi:pantetheine-phosphate adenylyltransferase
MKIAVYPGSFDPITNGHIDILNRSLQVFDRVILLVANNPAKKGTFTAEEKVAMIKEVFKDDPRISVDNTTELTVNYAKKHGAVAIVRGLRATGDFEYEFQLAAANRYIDDKIEMVFFMASGELSFISSGTIKELYFGGQDIKKLVPEPVYNKFRTKFPK